MTKEEMMRKLQALPDGAEVLIERDHPEYKYAEVKDVRLEYSQRASERKPYVIIDIYKIAR